MCAILWDMMRLSFSCLLGLALVGCGSNGGNGFDGGSDDSGNGDAGMFDLDSSIKPGDASPSDGGGGPAVIYAHTDDQLYVMDPTTKAVTLIGPFDDGSANAPTVTDLAVNQAGDVWVNTINTIYKANVPQTPGKVTITKVVAINVKTNQRFYAMGFTPPNVLGSGEMLVAGDSLGDLYAIDGQGQTTQLGSFGSAGGGAVYGLSGDIMFYVQNGKTRGLATVRPYMNGNATVTTNDVALSALPGAITGRDAPEPPSSAPAAPTAAWFGVSSSVPPTPKLPTESNEKSAIRPVVEAGSASWRRFARSVSLTVTLYTRTESITPWNGSAVADVACERPT